MTIEVQTDAGPALSFDMSRLRECLRGVGGDARAGAPLYREFHVSQETGSTNEVARDLALAGCASGAVVLADRQTAGRGRLDRRWYSPPAVNVYLSVVLRPPPEPQRPATLYPLVVALAVADAVAFCGVRDAQIKWPNDLLVKGEKLAGILCEYLPDAAGTPALVFGVGINVNLAPADLPPYLEGKATSLLAVLGRPLERERVVGLVLDRLRIRYRQFTETGAFPWPAWQRYWKAVGSRVKVGLEAGRLIGTVRGLSPEGGLVVTPERGPDTIVLAGDVTGVDEAD